MNFDFLKMTTLNELRSLYTEADWNSKWLFGWPTPLFLWSKMVVPLPSDKQFSAMNLYASVCSLENLNNIKNDKIACFELNYSLRRVIVRRDLGKFAKFLDATTAAELYKATEITQSSTE